MAARVAQCPRSQVSETVVFSITTIVALALGHHVLKVVEQTLSKLSICITKSNGMQCSLIEEEEEEEEEEEKKKEVEKEEEEKEEEKKKKKKKKRGGPFYLTV